MNETKKRTLPRGIYQRGRGRFFWIKWYKDGVATREPVKGALLGDGTIATGLKQREAERLLNLRKGAAERGAPTSPRVGRVTFDEAMDRVRHDYTTKQRRSFADMDRRIRLHLEPHFRGRRMATITPGSVTAYVAHRQAEGASVATCNRETSIVSHAFTLLLKDGTLFARPHIEMLPESNARQGFFEPEQVEAVCRHLPEPVVPLVRFMHVTGWRNQSEAYRLQWSWVGFAAGEVRLPPGVSKSKEPRTFAMTSALRRLLTAQRERVDAIQRERRRIVPTVFCWPDGRPIRNIRAAWRTACAKAGCPGRHQHDLRRTAIRGFVRAGISEQVAMKLSGHKTRAVFDRYDITSAADLRAAADRLDAAAGTRTAHGPRPRACRRPASPLSSREHSARKWRNWQTRRIQDPVVATPWGFKSPLSH
jgi:integrase